MKTWKNFLESKGSVESEEEQTGIDLDHDEEKGEPAAHKNKVTAKHEEMIHFFTKRMEGAKKIAAQAKEKGGPSILTAWHFAAKEAPYKEVLKAINANQGEPYYKSKWKSELSKIRADMKQQDFQEAAGRLEVWGEAMAQLFN
jgi:hypothetical protein